MANGDIKITELPVGTLAQGSLFITSEPVQGGGYNSTKIPSTEIATLVASIVSYSQLNSTNKTIVGAINEALSKTGCKFIVVQTLPTQDIDPLAIYLLPKTTPGTDDVYDEYIYTNNNWELIGTTQIDLSNYYTKTQTDTLLDTKASISIVADIYDNSATYTKGDYRINNKVLYVATTDITTAEDFDPSHWSAVLIMDEVALKADSSDIPTKTSDLVNDSIPVVTANPDENPTAELTKLKVGSTVYDFGK